MSICIIVLINNALRLFHFVTFTLFFCYFFLCWLSLFDLKIYLYLFALMATMNWWNILYEMNAIYGWVYTTVIRVDSLSFCVNHLGIAVFMLSCDIVCTLSTYPWNENLHKLDLIAVYFICTSSACYWVSD